MRIYCFGINLIFTSVIVSAGMVDRSSSGQNRVRPFCPCLIEAYAFGLGRRGGAFYLGHPVLGRKSLDGKMVSRTERSLDEAKTRSSDVETGETTCSGSDVRDP